jgi:Mn-dependent DtxR family transcriptional regulator
MMWEANPGKWLRYARSEVRTVVSLARRGLLELDGRGAVKLTKDGVAWCDAENEKAAKRK